MYSQYIDYLRTVLDERRFIHSLNVADECKKLALHYNYEFVEKAYLAGLLHDVCKNDSKEKMLQIFNQFDIILDNVQKGQFKLWHSLAGSLFVQDKFGITDSEIISAIKYHTTGKENMSMLEKILYLADFISADRDYDGVDEIRKSAYVDLNKTLIECYKFSIIEVTQKGCPVHIDTVKGYNYLLTER